MTCEIKLENNIKIITFRSTLNVENQTHLPIEMIVVDAHGKASSGAMKIGKYHPCTSLMYRTWRIMSFAFGGCVREEVQVAAIA